MPANRNRTWTIAKLGSAEELVTKLNDMQWCLCQGFEVDGILWLNDAFGEDGAQEYAVVRRSDGVQLESITVSWCDRAKLEKYVTESLSGTWEGMWGTTKRSVREEQLQTPEEHGADYCHLCA